MDTKKITLMLLSLFAAVGLIFWLILNKDSHLGHERFVQPASSSRIELTFWNMFGGGEGDYVEQIIEQFNESQPDVTVKELRLDSREYYAKLGTALASGRGPDIAIIHTDRLSPFVKSDQLAPLNHLAEEEKLDVASIADSNMRSVTFLNTIYAIPLDTHFHMLYYNKNLLQQAGLLSKDGDPQFDAVTPEKFKSILEQIKQSLPNIVPLGINIPYFQQPFLCLYYQAGGELLNEDMTRSTINNPIALKVLQYYMELFDANLSDPNDNTPWETFQKGESALWIGGVWEAGWHLSTQSLDVGITAIPPIFGSNFTWGSSHTLAIPAFVAKEKQLAAMAFIKYYTTEGSKVWAQAGHVPANQKVLESEEYLSLPYRDRFVEAAKGVKFAPETDKYNAIDLAIRESLQLVVSRKMSPEAGLANMEKKINAILED